MPTRNTFPDRNTIRMKAAAAGSLLPTVLMVLMAFVGCQSMPTPTFAPSSLRQGSTKAPESGFAPASHREELPGRPVTLEGDVDEAGENSRWSKLLNPFARKKKRIPLPLTQENGGKEDDPALTGF